METFTCHAGTVRNSHNKEFEQNSKSQRWRMAGAKVTFTRVKSLLSPDGEQDVGIGKNISHSQPDVEVLALALKRVPCTREAFEKSKAIDKDWICLQFYV